MCGYMELGRIPAGVSICRFLVAATVYGVDVLVFTEGEPNAKSEVEDVFLSLDVASMVDEAAEGMTGRIPGTVTLPCGLGQHVLCMIRENPSI